MLHPGACGDVREGRAVIEMPPHPNISYKCGPNGYYRICDYIKKKISKSLLATLSPFVSIKAWGNNDHKPRKQARTKLSAMGVL